MSAIRVFLVDDHKIVIDGIKSLLEGEAQFEVCGLTVDSLMAPEMIEKLQPDIVISDIQMPGLSGKEIIAETKRRSPATRILSLSMSGDAATIAEMLDAGASGYLLKNTGREELCEALLKIHQGETYICAAANVALTKSFLERKRNPQEQEETAHLTPREIEIIALIAKEMSNAQIGETLFISERTVETHRKNIFRKTGTKSVLGLVKYATERKLI